MKIFLLIIAIVVLIVDVRYMQEERDKQNLVGVVYWGFMTLILIISIKTS